MTMVYNSPTYSFLIEVTNDDGDLIMHFRIDQRVRNVNRIVEVDRAHSNVEKTLHDYHLRTGLNYSAYGAGPRDEIDKLIESKNIKLD